jgi:hypothetical protein
MAQVSSSVANKPQQAVHAGLNFAFAAYNSAGLKTPFSGSVSDSIVMLNLPRNAEIVMAYLGGITDDGNMGFSLGDPGSNTRWAAVSISSTALGMVFYQGPTAYTYSVSDDQNTFPLTLHLQNVTSLSGSLSVHLGVIWRKK